MLRKMVLLSTVCGLMLLGSQSHAEINIKKYTEIKVAVAKVIELRNKTYSEVIASARIAIDLEEQELKKSKTLYIKEDHTSVFEDPALTKVISELQKNSVVFVTETVKNSDGKIIGYQVRTDYENEISIGFVKEADTFKSVASRLEVTYKGVDYEPMEKTPETKDNKRVKVKGIYITTHTADSERFWALIDNAKRAGVNALVIDFKDDSENFLFETEAGKAYLPGKSPFFFIKEKDAFMEKLKKKDMYLIARIVAFKSPRYAAVHKDRAITDLKTGGLYSDNGMIWASPYDRDLWEYNAKVAKEAADAGFDEVQFDYVRFPASADGKLDKNLNYNNKENETKTEAVQKFLLHAKSVLKETGTFVSADVFGWTASSNNDVGIGQHWEGMSNVVDYMCPMIYPSHYGPGIYGLAVPDAKPYETIFRNIADAKVRDSNILTPAIQRPWIQDFTATWVKGHIKYGDEEVRLQIKALKDQGIEEYILWNATNKYHFGGLK